MPKTILITGASSGFGEACAKTFAREGNTLILVARRKHLLDTLAQSLSEQCTVHTAQVDVSSADSIQAFFSQLPSDLPAIDILINNAGLALGLEPANEANLEDWETMIHTNCLGLVRFTRHVLPCMVENNSGHIVNIGSTAGKWPYPGGNVYGATKAFVQQFSRNLRADLVGKHIRVSNIDPGMAETEFSNVRFKGNDEQAQQVYQNAEPLTAQDIADTIDWVCNRPAHVNINSLELMPVCQAWGPWVVDRSHE